MTLTFKQWLHLGWAGPGNTEAAAVSVTAAAGGELRSIFAGSRSARSSEKTVACKYNYNKFILENINNASIFDLRLKSRIFVQIGTGDNWASESKLNFAGGNNEDLMNNEF